MARVYEELRGMAHRELRAERPDLLLHTTALVHEAYLRLCREVEPRLESRAHFFQAAATAMRRILVDEARRRLAAKRGGGAERVPLGRAEGLEADRGLDAGAIERVEVLDRALKNLEARPRIGEKTKVVELRFFAGLSIEDTARVLGLSPATVKRDWNFARAWLRREIDRLAPELG